MTRQTTLYVSDHTERMAQEIAEHRGLPAERYRTRLYEALVSEEHGRMTQAQEAEMKYGVEFVNQEQQYMLMLNGTMTKAEARAERDRLNAELQSQPEAAPAQVAGYDDGPLYCHYCGKKVSDYRPTFGFFDEPACKECGGS